MADAVGAITLANDPIINIDALVRQALRELYDTLIADGVLPPDYVNQMFWQITYTPLLQVVNDTYKELQQFADLKLQMQTNASVFAAFKSHKQSNDLAKLLLNDNGEIRSFYEFRKATVDIVKEYNVTWLQAEYDVAQRSARMAANWVTFQKSADVYPNLEYKPSRAATPREAHKPFYGIVLPIDHPWWDTHFPPNGWRCKCTVRPSRKAVTEQPTGGAVEKGFDFNPGKQKQLFANSHPYYEVATAQVQNSITEQAIQLHSDTV